MPRGPKGENRAVLTKSNVLKIQTETLPDFAWIDPSGRLAVPVKFGGRSSANDGESGSGKLAPSLREALGPGLSGHLRERRHDQRQVKRSCVAAVRATTALLTRHAAPMRARLQRASRRLPQPASAAPNAGWRAARSWTAAGNFPTIKRSYRTASSFCARASRFMTLDTCHRDPRGVRTLRSFRAVVMAPML